MVFIQWRGDADNNGIHRGELRKVGGGLKSVRLGGLNLFCRDAIDVGTALGQRIHLAGVDIEPGHPEFLLAVQQGQRKADVTQSNDAHAGLVVLDSGLELVDRGVCSRVGCH